MFARDTRWNFYFKLFALFITGAYIVHLYIAKENFNLLISILNSVGLLVLAAYIFKTYALPAIKEHIEQHRDLFQRLYNRSDALNSRKHLLEQRIVSEQELMEHLSDKVRDWHDRWIRASKAQEQETNRIREQRAQKRKIQSYYVTREHVRQEMSMQAIERARTALTEQFSVVEKGEQFLGTIVEHMHEEKQ